jgi:hypothetical protein
MHATDKNYLPSMPEITLPTNTIEIPSSGTIQAESSATTVKTTGMTNGNQQSNSPKQQIQIRNPTVIPVQKLPDKVFSMIWRH